MRVLKNGFDVDRFFEQVALADECILVTEYEGVIAAPWQRGQTGALHPEVREVLQELARTTRLVVVTEHSLKLVHEILDLQPAPEIWGVGGLERLTSDGRYDLVKLAGRQLRGIAEADEIAAAKGFESWLEQKPGAVALRLEGVPPETAAKLRQKALAAWSEIALEYSLLLTNVGEGVELRVRGRSRSELVGTVFAEAGPTTPMAYLGGSILAESAFAALSGRGLNVLVGEYVADTLADVQITPRELAPLLRAWLRRREAAPLLEPIMSRTAAV
jgi:trehalose-6-phosphatase